MKYLCNLQETNQSIFDVHLSSMFRWVEPNWKLSLDKEEPQGSEYEALSDRVSLAKKKITDDKFFHGEKGKIFIPMENSGMETNI